jgi:hypothetical protein
MDFYKEYTTQKRIADDALKLEKDKTGEAAKLILSETDFAKVEAIHILTSEIVELSKRMKR